MGGGGAARLLEEEVDDALRKPITAREKHARDDHEADHDPGRLNHLRAVRPLYPVKLTPASLQKPHQPHRRARSMDDLPAGSFAARTLAGRTSRATAATVLADCRILIGLGVVA